VLGALILGEPLTPRTAAAAVIVLVGVWLVRGRPRG
jgi:drug/metabolite transporter (DMT)-like permease